MAKYDITTILLFAASVVSIPLTTSLSGIYAVAIPLGLLTAAFFSADKNEEKYGKEDF